MEQTNLFPWTFLKILYYKDKLNQHVTDLHGEKLLMVEQSASSFSSNLLRGVYIRRVAHSDRTRQNLTNWSLLILSMSLFVAVSDSKLFPCLRNQVFFSTKEHPASQDFSCTT